MISMAVKKVKSTKTIEYWTELINGLIDKFNPLLPQSIIISELPNEEMKSILINLAKSRRHYLEFIFMDEKKVYLIWIEPF